MGKGCWVWVTLLVAPALVSASQAPTGQAWPAKKPASKAKVLYNEDLERLRSRALNVVGPAAAAATTEAAPAEGEGEAGAESAPGGEERTSLPAKETTAEHWQERLKPLRDELAKTEQQIQQLRRSSGQAASNTIDFLGSNPGVQVEDTLRRLEQRRAQLQQEIESVQLEAKRKGIPPGKLR